MGIFGRSSTKDSDSITDGRGDGSFSNRKLRKDTEKRSQRSHHDNYDYNLHSPYPSVSPSIEPGNSSTDADPRALAQQRSRASNLHGVSPRSNTNLIPKWEAGPSAYELNNGMNGRPFQPSSTPESQAIVSAQQRKSVQEPAQDFRWSSTRHTQQSLPIQVNYPERSQRSQQQEVPKPGLDRLRAAYDRRVWTNSLRQETQHVVFQYVEALQHELAEADKQRNIALSSRVQSKDALCRANDELVVLAGKLPSALNLHSTESNGQNSLQENLRNLTWTFEYQWNELNRQREQNGFLKGQTEDNKSVYENQIVGLKREATDLKADLATQQQDHQQRISKLEDGHALSIQQLSSSYISEIEGLKKQHSDAVNWMKNKFEQETNQMVSGHELEREQLLQIHTKEKNQLQEAIVTPSDTFQPLPDSMFKSNVEDLRRLVLGLARTVYRAHLTTSMETTKQADNRPDFVRGLPQASWKFAIESEIWAVLWHYLLCDYGFAAFGDWGNRLAITWTSMFRSESAKPNATGNVVFPRPDATTEKWRSTMFETLRLGLSEDAGGHLASEELRQGYHDAYRETCGQLAAVLHKVAPPDQSAEIGHIVAKAQSLALDVGTSRARLEFFGPALHQENPTGNLEDCSGLATHRPPRVYVQLVVAPGLRRIGDIRGGAMDRTEEILPPRVYLREGSA